MLPSEMALLAHGWPRKASAAAGGGRPSGSTAVPSSRPPAAAAATAGGAALASSSAAPVIGSEDSFDEEMYLLPGAHAARMLHRVRRAERSLLSYELTGWLEEVPSVVTHRNEIRPAAELGPIIVCLDTSGSMRGARELVAKALALECLRGAHRQRRKCFVYAFSGECGADGRACRRQPLPLPLQQQQ